MSNKEVIHWADSAAKKIIAEKGNKESYVCEAAITPSGTVHIGNFREIITVDLVRRALESIKKKVRFIYSWDDYDVFRKVPKNMPKQEELKKYLRMPIIETPDVYGCHDSYAEHNESEVEEDIPKVGINPEFIYQSKKYRKGDYADEIKFCLENTDKIKEVLNEFRTEPLKDDWLPVAVFCEKCKKDTINSLKYEGGHEITYECDCGHKETFDFRKKGIVKLAWRVDWPMRWVYEKVDFESGGKDHFTAGGSFDSANKLIKALWDRDAPSQFRYDFVRIKGAGGKISSSEGNVITLKDVLEVYEPDMVRWLFAGTRPGTEFAISFDTEVIKNYEEFDKVERIYYGEENVSDKEKSKQKRIYELSCVDKPQKKIPFQPSFRNLTNVLQTHVMDVEKSIGYYEKELKHEFDKERLRLRANCAKNWLEKHAPEDFRFVVQDKLPKLKLSENIKKLLKEIAKKLKERDWTDKELHEEFYVLVNNSEVNNKDFFKSAYNVLINKDKGPQLANFILTIGKDRVINLFEKL
ncbi:lysine--tRNA ligase [Nanoarchaeota archaeon]